MSKDKPLALENAPQGESLRMQRSALALVLVLLVVFASLAVTSLRQKSVTIDEIMYLAAGYYHLETGDFTLNMTNPPLMKMLAALPLLALHPELPAVDSPPATWSLPKQWRFSRDFLYHNRIDADRMLFFSRLPFVALGVILGLYLFVWCRELYGSVAGVFATLLYAVSPNMLAHTRLAAHDMGLTVLMFIATFYFWRYMRNPNFRSLLACGFCCGLAALTKTTSVFLVPVFGIFVLYCMARRVRCGVHDALPGVGKIAHERLWLGQLTTGLWAGSIIALVALLVLNAGYTFSGTFSPYVAEGATESGRVASLLGWIPIPAPRPFVELVRFQRELTAISGGVYFAGVYYATGKWWLMLVAFALKTPLATLIMLMGGGVGLVWTRGQNVGRMLAPIFIGVLMFVFSYLSNINVGIRYILPIYPFVFMVVAGLFAVAWRRTTVGVILLGLLAGWNVWACVSIHPDYLAHFNELIGGPRNGYKYLVDSNLDWGQDLKGLKAYQDKKGIGRIALAYFGSADADYYGINYSFLPSVGLAPQKAGQHWWYENGSGCYAPEKLPKGTLAISATMLVSPGWLERNFGPCYAELREKEPVDQVGYSILIYDIK